MFYRIKILKSNPILLSLTIKTHTNICTVYGVQLQAHLHKSSIQFILTQRNLTKTLNQPNCPAVEHIKKQLGLWFVCFSLLCLGSNPQSTAASPGPHRAGEQRREKDDTQGELDWHMLDRMNWGGVLSVSSQWNKQSCMGNILMDTVVVCSLIMLPCKLMDRQWEHKASQSQGFLLYMLWLRLGNSMFFYILRVSLIAVYR